MEARKTADGESGVGFDKESPLCCCCGMTFLRLFGGDGIKVLSSSTIILFGGAIILAFDEETTLPFMFFVPIVE